MSRLPGSPQNAASQPRNEKIDAEIWDLDTAAIAAVENDYASGNVVDPPISFTPPANGGSGRKRKP